MSKQICNCPFGNPGIAIADNCPLHGLKKDNNSNTGTVTGGELAKWYLIPTSFKPLGELRDIIIAEMDINVTNELTQQVKELQEENERLRKAIRGANEVLKNTEI